MIAARILVTVKEMSLFNIFLVLLVKTECMMVSKMGATWIKISYYVLLNIVTICLVIWSVTARVSEPIADCSCTERRNFSFQFGSSSCDQHTLSKLSHRVF